MIPSITINMPTRFRGRPATHSSGQELYLRNALAYLSLLKGSSHLSFGTFSYIHLVMYRSDAMLELENFHKTIILQPSTHVT